MKQLFSILFTALLLICTTACSEKRIQLERPKVDEVKQLQGHSKCIHRKQVYYQENGGNSATYKPKISRNSSPSGSASLPKLCLALLSTINLRRCSLFKPKL